MPLTLELVRHRFECVASGCIQLEDAKQSDRLLGMRLDGFLAIVHVDVAKRSMASGPPLPVLLRALERLRDLRLAADRKDIPSRHADLEKLRTLL